MQRRSDRNEKNEMVEVSQEVEITVRVRNEPGVLAKLFTTVASSSTSILACSSYSNGEWAVVLLVTRNPSRTERALDNNGFTYGTGSVVLVNAVDRLGSPVQLTARLRAAGIGLLYSYTWWSESLKGRAVFKTQDDNHAIQVLQDYLANEVSEISDTSSPPTRLKSRRNDSLAGQRQGCQHVEHTQRY